MADFNSFLPTLLKHEGGYVNDPADPGGATNKGITIATFSQCAQRLLGIAPSLDALRGLTDQQAGVIYKALYWDAIRGDRIALQPLAEIVFDFQVNAGSQSAKLLQRVLNDLGAHPPLVVDGAIGAGTLAALDATDAYVVYARFKQGRADYYRALVQKRPALGKFLKGWLNRVASFPDLTPPTAGSV
jgi:lysozyme family protein